MATDKIAELEKLYADLPTMQCKKLCGPANCGPLQASHIETKRIEKRTGLVKIIDRQKWQSENFQFRHLPYLPQKNEFYRSVFFWEPDKADGWTCQFLMPTIHTCRIYSIRPMICRLWGCVDHPYLRCPHGCAPDRWLSVEEARKIFQEIIKIQETP